MTNFRSLSRRMRDKTPIEQLMARVEIEGSCWIFKGARDASGYARIVIGGERSLVHRLAYELLVGPIPDGLEIDHRCHKRVCVRPDHLRAVTRTQNVQNHQGATRVSLTGIRNVHRRPPKYKLRPYQALVEIGDRRVKVNCATLEEAASRAIELRREMHTHNDLDRGPS